MRRILWFFFLVMVQCTPQVFAQNNQNQKNTSTGDIDMNQFQDLQSARKAKAPENRVQVTTTCLDAHGTIIKKGDRGFETCIANSQARILNKNANPEAPDDSRKH